MTLIAADRLESATAVLDAALAQARDRGSARTPSCRSLCPLEERSASCISW